MSAPRDLSWKVARGVGVLVALIATIHVAYYFPRCVDDLFISLRYAESLAHGRGIVFNPGQRVEGYSSPLWMLLQAIGIFVGFEPVTWTKVLGFVSLGGIAVGVQRLAREHLGLASPIPLLASVFIVLDSHIVAWSVLGLETPLYLALLVWYPIALRRYLDASSRKKAWIAGAIAVALACARPEAPMFLGAIGVAELVARPVDPTSATNRARVVAGLRLAVPVLAVLVALLLARHAYFGSWLPNTYYVKGASSGWELAKLQPLVGEGVGTMERLFYVGGIVLAIVIAVKHRAPTLIVAMVCAMFFTASVERDWMPSLRHLLPVPVFASIAWAWAVDRVARWPALRERSHTAAGTLAAMVIGTGLQLASIDCRVSSIERGIRERPWALAKTPNKIRDSWLALRGIEPPHIKAFGSYEMGLITQNYRVLEASAAPLEESWYIGRDIGQVAFYTDVRVFDTPGLFTPDVVRSETWQRKHAVDADLVRRAFALRPVAAELLDAWTGATAAHADLGPYEIVSGSPSDPVDLVQRDRPRPTPLEVRRRYERSLAKFPQWFDLATLYGENAGAAMRKRVRIVRDIVESETSDAPPPTPPSLGREHGAGAVLEGTIASLGCELSPTTVRAGDAVKVTCWWRGIATPTQTFLTFLHFDDDQGTPAFQEDHPAIPFRPTTELRPGEIVRDVTRVTVPAGVPAGSYRLRFGMWKGDMRPAVTPRDMSDGKDRIPAGVLQVVR